MALLLSNSAVHNRLNPDILLQKIIDEKRYRDIILVLPTNRNVHGLKQRIIFQSSSAIPSLNIFTLEQLIRKLYSSVRQNKYEVESDIQSILIEKAAQKLFKEKSLGFFKMRPDGKLPRGTFERVFRIIKEFKEDGIYPENLEDDLKAIDAKEIEKTNDIIKIYKEYNTLLGDTFIDKGGIYKKVTEQFTFPFSNEIFRKAFPDANEIHIYGFSEFSNPEISILSSIALIPQLSVTFYFDYNSDNSSLFGIMKQNVDVFFDLNLHTGIISENNADVELREHLEKNLFTGNKKIEKPDFSEKITIFSAKDQLEEIEKVCKIIKDIIIENPEQDLSRICVATYSTGNYTGLFREFFDKYGLPANITDRYVLSQSPVISSLVSLLMIPVNNYRKKEIFRALLSPYMIFKKSADRTIDADTLFNIANELKITFGKESWKEKISGKLRFWERKKSDAEIDENSIKNEIYKLREAGKDFDFLVNLLSPLESGSTPGAFEQKIIQLINKLEIPSQILKLSRTPNGQMLIEKDLRALSAFLNILRNLNKLYELKSSGKTEISLTEYLEDLKTALANTKYNVKPRHGSGILITAAEETRGLNFDYMFLAGMIDGEFPIAFKPEIFKPEIRRKSEEKHFLESRYLFYQTISNFDKKLFISFPKYKDDTELIPSGFIDALKDIVVTSDSLPDRLFESAYSTEELQMLIGNILNFGGDLTAIPQDYQKIINDLKLKSIIEGSRSETHEYPNYEGIIGENSSEKAKTRLTELRDKEYSISELEEYGKCPMRYLFSRLLKVNIYEESDDDITAMEFGSIVHEALYQFFSKWRKENPERSFYSQTETERAENIEILKSLAIKKVEELNITNPFFKIDFTKVIGDGETKKGILHRFLEHEMNRKNSIFNEYVFEPSFFEVSFGSNTGEKDSTDAVLSTEKSIILNGIKMRGKVDRIDIFKNGDAFIFVIIDYKTGKIIPGLKDITEGISLQIPIYISCINDLLKNQFNSSITAAGGLYYLLHATPDITPGIGNMEYFAKTRSTKITDAAKYESMVNKSSEYIKEYVEGITAGNFGFPKPERNLAEICRYCNFITACRIKRVKVIENND